MAETTAYEEVFHYLRDNQYPDIFTKEKFEEKGSKVCTRKRCAVLYRRGQLSVTTMGTQG